MPLTWRDPLYGLLPNLRCPRCSSGVRWLDVLGREIPLARCERCAWIGRRSDATQG